jgi:alkylhydroperoxidase family enzyme
VLLAGVLAADLSGCRWCIDRTRHDWRTAGFPLHLLEQLRAHAEGRQFTSRERAALSFVTAVSGEQAHQDDIDRARVILSDDEIAELTAIAAERHCLEHIDFNLLAL